MLMVLMGMSGKSSEPPVTVEEILADYPQPTRENIQKYYWPQLSVSPVSRKTISFEVAGMTTKLLGAVWASSAKHGAVVITSTSI
jgi:hypothetical protein